MINSEASSFIVGMPFGDLQDGVEEISMEQLRHLVHLIEQSDTVELTVRHCDTKARLVLRKARLQENDIAYAKSLSLTAEAISPTEADQRQHTITAPFVGLFQSWSTSKGTPLVAVGDVVKEGQHVGVIRSMGIPNEVEMPIAGRVITILAQDGQAVEYGQPLMTIEKQ